MKAGKAGIPGTLQDAIRYFGDPDNFLNFAAMVHDPSPEHGDPQEFRRSPR